MVQAIDLARGRTITFGRIPLVMGIVNVTPDSFSDGGVHYRSDVAIDAAIRMAEEGAAIVDVGGESTRPGALPASLEEELERVMPVIEGIRQRSEIAISIDTMKAEVARRALDSGADIVNDVTAMRHDAEMAGVVASSGAPVILMHMRGEPRTMQSNIHYDDLMGEIAAELAERVEAAGAAGIDRSRILVDPGIGFGKTFEHNAEILRDFSTLEALGPVVIGASRKAFIGHVTGRAAGPDRVAGSLAAVAAAAAGGAAIVRVHDVGSTIDFLRVYDAIRGGGE
ncbi:MAG: dihydropteroate synthase [Acidobacteria bacterium]|nr:dihydropteroate synthase [Acidobacteriota bacterium]